MANFFTWVWIDETFSKVDFCKSYNARICLPCLTSIASILVLVRGGGGARAGVLVYVDIISASSAGVECLLREECVPGGDRDIPASSIGVLGRLRIIISPPKRVSVSMIIGGVDVVDWLCWVGVGRPCWMSMGASLISLSILVIEGWLCRVLVCEA